MGSVALVDQAQGLSWDDTGDSMETLEVEMAVEFEWPASEERVLATGELASVRPVARLPRDMDMGTTGQ